MNAVTPLLSDLLESHGWTVASPRYLDLGAEFTLVAENDVAIAFAADAETSTVMDNAGALSAAIGAFLGGVGGAKTWDAYLILVVPVITDDIEDDVIRVQRDLTYCRKLVLDQSGVLSTDNPTALLEQKLALLFPLRVSETVKAISPRHRLEQELIGRGTSQNQVTALLDGLTDPGFDGVSYLRRQEDPIA